MGSTDGRTGNVSPRPPLWFLDVDGVCQAVSPRPATLLSDDWRYAEIPGYLINWRTALVDTINRLNRDGRLEVRWLATWNLHAVSDLSPVFGFDAFPVQNTTSQNGTIESFGLSWWKYLAVREALQHDESRRFIWADDDLGGIVKERAESVYGDRCLLITPDSRHGLTDASLSRIEAWL